MTKKVETREFLDSVTELVQAGKEVPIPIAGGSMLPFLAPNRDSVLLTAPRFPLKKGDVALFRRPNGSYVLHRVFLRNEQNGTGVYYFVGDNQLLLEGPVPEAAICAIASKANRKGKVLSTRSPIWLFFSILWIRILPWRKRLQSAYSRLKKH